MATCEDELETLVRERGFLDLVHGRLRWLQEMHLRGERPVAPDPVDRAVAGGRRQPGAGVLRLPVAGPSRCRNGERLLRGLLGEVEVAEEADQVGEDPAPLVTEDPVEQGYRVRDGGR